MSADSMGTGSPTNTGSSMMPHRLSPDALTRHWRGLIPLLESMAFQVTDWDGHTLTTRAPLERNRNDKQTGFAGSIAALASVTGWGLATLVAQKADKPFQVAIRDSQQSYNRPVEGDLLARVSITAGERHRFAEELRLRGKARLNLIVIVGTEKVAECARLNGTYVAWQVPAEETETHA